jgi:release factor glutamine methyltransferase
MTSIGTPEASGAPEESGVSGASQPPAQPQSATANDSTPALASDSDAQEIDPHKLWNDSTRILELAGVPSPEHDAREIAEFVIGKPPYMWPNSISEGDADRIEDLVAKRKERIPLQHILGKMWFLGLELKAQPGVFSVRPETEVLAEWAIQSLSKLSENKSFGSVDPLRVLDLCTGAGPLALSISRAYPNAKVVAVEQSKVAAEVATENAQALGVPVEVLHADALALNPDWVGSYDLVVSNPPYVPPRKLEPELDHDPEEALWGGGEDGLDFIRDLIPIAHEYLKPGGWLGIEHDDSQGTATVELAREAGFIEAYTLQDLNLRDRFLIAHKA